MNCSNVQVKYANYIESENSSFPKEFAFITATPESCKIVLAQLCDCISSSASTVWGYNPSLTQ